MVQTSMVELLVGLFVCLVQLGMLCLQALTPVLFGNFFKILAVGISVSQVVFTVEFSIFLVPKGSENWLEKSGSLRN